VRDARHGRVAMAIYDLLQQALEERPELEGVTSADIAELPKPLRELLLKTMRVGTVSLAEMAVDLGLNHDEAGCVAGLLIGKGFLAEAGEGPDEEGLYRINLARRKGRSVPADIWSSITKPSDDKKS
jgi:hypothetical protein